MHDENPQRDRVKISRKLSDFVRWYRAHKVRKPRGKRNRRYRGKPAVIRRGDYVVHLAGRKCWGSGCTFYNRPHSLAHICILTHVRIRVYWDGGGKCRCAFTKNGHPLPPVLVSESDRSNVRPRTTSKPVSNESRYNRPTDTLVPPPFSWV